MTTPVTDEAKRLHLEKCLRFTEAVLDAMDSAIRSADPSDPWRFASYAVYLRKSNGLVDSVRIVEPTLTAPVEYYDMSKVPSMGSTIGMQQQNLFEMARTNLQILKAYLANRVEPKTKQVVEIADFLQANLRRAMLDKPEREKDVQDTIEQLFIGRGMEKGIDYDREVGRVKMSSKEVVPDFVLPNLNTAIEAKLLRDRSKVGEVVDQINADIRSYGKDYGTIVFVVYDLGALRDEAEFRRDLESADGVKVIVVKH